MSSHDPDRFQQVCDIFERARAILREERDKFLEGACGGDEALRQEVLALLLHHDVETGLLDKGVTPSPASMRVGRQQRPLPERIGKYAITRELGEGGMGVVYLAKQDHPAREVAIKVMRPELLNEETRRRFEFESTVLGRLQHPGVAQIYEAGIHDEQGVSQPYFAMEYVDGQALNQYLVDTSPSVRERLDLFTQICDAVHHAHQKGVVHRDLKPSNIFVVSPSASSDDATTSESRARRPPRIKVLDFGVARATDGDLQVTTLHTDLGQLVGTLPYMSPEQIGGHARDVDTRSDVYALGVVLYEMLAGKLPYELTEQAIVKAAKIITEQEPAPLSTVSNIYRGDLNTIALKALEKQPDRRYSSASDLAADVQRYLDNQPIVARRASAMYQLRKFASRNKGLVAGMVAAAVMLIAGAITSSMFAIGQTRALRESERQRAVAEAVIEFVNDDLLAKANPYHSAVRELTVREALESAASSIESRFADQPEVEASIRYTLGRSFQGLGRFQEATTHIRPALAFFETVYKPDDERLFEARAHLAQNVLAQWKLDEVEPMMNEYLALAETHLGERHAWTAKLLAKSAVVLKRRGQFVKAEETYRRALEILESQNDEDARTPIIIRNNLALVLRDQNRLNEAEAILRDVAKRWEQLYGRKHLDSAFGLMSLGDLLWDQATEDDVDPEIAKRQLDEAEQLFRDALAIRQELLGEEHPDTANSIYALGLIYSARGDYTEGERLQRQALAIRRTVFGTDEHVDVLDSMNAVATALRRQERYNEAKDFSKAALETAERTFGVTHFSSNRYRGALYAALWNLGDVAEIESLNENYKDKLPKGDQAWGIHALAEAHATNGDYQQAVELKKLAIETLPPDSSLREFWKKRLEELAAKADTSNRTPN